MHFLVGFFQYAMNLVTLRNIEVLLAADRSQKIEKLFNKYAHKCIDKFSIFIPLILEILSFIVPIHYSNIFPMMNTIAISTMIVMLLVCGTGLIYVYKLQRLIHSMQISRTFYDDLEVKFKKLFQTCLISWIIAEILCLFWIIIPVFHENMYIVYNIQMLSGHLGAIGHLRLTSADTSSPANSSFESSPTNKPGNSKDIASPSPSSNPIAPPTRMGTPPLEMRTLDVSNHPSIELADTTRIETPLAMKSIDYSAYPSQENLETQQEQHDDYSPIDTMISIEPEDRNSVPLFNPFNVKNITINEETTQ